MVKLYYTPTSCGASSFICAHISNLNYDCEIVDLATHKTESGVDFYSINPKGNVPTLILDDGTILNENISCLEFIADEAMRVNNIELAPHKDCNERHVLRQLLSFLASELHPTIGLFFNPKSKENNVREFIKSVFDRKMKYLEKHILNNGKKYVYSDKFTIADAYLHIILTWTGYVGVDIEEYPIANNYLQNILSLEITKNPRILMSTSPSKTNLKT